MQQLLIMVKRNIKLFFKDKGAFFSTMITPLILLVLYVSFLANVYKQSYAEVLPPDVPEKLLNALVGGQLTSSLLSVVCVTVAFCSNMIMVADKVSGARNDMNITPVSRTKVALSYYIATVCATLIICLTAMALCFIYLAVVGWYLSFGDVLLILLDVIILVLFGVGFSTAINYFLSSQGQIVAVSTIISSAYGFISGAYMPISQMGKGFGYFVGFLPGTYGTTLMRNHCHAGALAEMEKLGWGSEAIDGVKGFTDCNLSFFGHTVSVGVMYAVILTTVAVLLGICILQHFLARRKATK